MRLVEADLSDADLTGCDLSGADLSRARRQGGQGMNQGVFGGGFG